MLISFGAACVGNDEFVEDYNSIDNLETIAIVRDDDLLPHYPMGYHYIHNAVVISETYPFVSVRSTNDDVITLDHQQIPSNGGCVLQWKKSKFKCSVVHEHYNHDMHCGERHTDFMRRRSVAAKQIISQHRIPLDLSLAFDHSFPCVFENLMNHAGIRYYDAINKVQEQCFSANDIKEESERKD